MNWTIICLSWPVFILLTWCARVLTYSFNPYFTSVYIQSFLQEAIYPLLTLFPGFVFSSFIPLILKLFLLERSSRSTSLFSIYLAQVGLVFWMTPMSFLRLNRFLSILDIFNGNIGWSHDNFPWVDGWLLILWPFDDCLLI